VRRFCQQRRTSEPSFYQWRKRFSQQHPVRFALVETGPDAGIHAEGGSDSDLWRAALYRAGGRRSHAACGAERVAGSAMIHLPASVRVYLATTPCDMRRSFDGLHALVSAVMQLDAFAGHLFVFANRRRDRVKILYWDRDGFAMWAKRLEEGTYATPFSEGGEGRREITAQELGALLSGIDLESAQRRKRYQRNAASI